ncbi:multifunctional oxoglutarate decarboxylase/oxoglutarate dehydrogenase thiamine pyrophosphate-binding subunit/dihydrolipoyllysine-residue succinyltransferase subunit, partial [Streptomyces sp. WAC05374]
MSSQSPSNSSISTDQDGQGPSNPAAAFGANEWLVDEIYQQYLQDPNSVDRAWWDFFADYKPGAASGSADKPAGGSAVAAGAASTAPATPAQAPATPAQPAAAAPAQAAAPAPAAPAPAATPGATPHASSRPGFPRPSTAHATGGFRRPS